MTEGLWTTIIGAVVAAVGAVGGWLLKARTLPQQRRILDADAAKKEAETYEALLVASKAIRDELQVQLELIRAEHGKCEQQIRELRAENEELRHRVHELELQVDDLQERSGSWPAVGAGARDDTDERR